jgi:hypothetical protein
MAGKCSAGLGGWRAAGGGAAAQVPRPPPWCCQPGQPNLVVCRYQLPGRLWFKQGAIAPSSAACHHPLVYVRRGGKSAAGTLTLRLRFLPFQEDGVLAEEAAAGHMGDPVLGSPPGTILNSDWRTLQVAQAAVVPLRQPGTRPCALVAASKPMQRATLAAAMCPSNAAA